MIKEKVVRPLKGLKVAPYYGCQIVRPYATFDDAWNPTTMDRLLATLGAEVVPYPLKTKCCGGSLTGTVPEAGLRLTYILLKEAVRRGADVIATTCPLCQFNLDAYHDQINQRWGPARIATVYFTQLMGLAFGMPPEQLGSAARLYSHETTASAIAQGMNTNNQNGEVRIGFYICHCGHNIAGMVDCAAVAQYIAKIPGVAVSRDYKYMCSDPGQELIQQDIKEHQLNRIVVASCSPLLHEHTFRKAVAAGGLNPFFFQMVNIREHDSWVHTDRAEATAKAKALARAAVSRVRFHRALETTRVPINPDVLVVGGGIAGIHAALTVANSGKKVFLVERDPSIGGHMAQFDKTFPTLDCAACILTPKMSAVRSHENITLWTYSEVVKVEGYVGNYKVTVKRKPRYVNEELCVGCMECITACVFKEGKFPDEFNVGLSKRKPIYIPFAQAVPPVVVIDPERCLQVRTGKCKKTCIEACADRQAIDFTQKEELVEIKVGNIIVATGLQTLRCQADSRNTATAYYPNVVTAIELERLVNSSGPTGGRNRPARRPQAQVGRA